MVEGRVDILVGARTVVVDVMIEENVVDNLVDDGPLVVLIDAVGVLVVLTGKGEDATVKVGDVDNNLVV